MQPCCQRTTRGRIKSELRCRGVTIEFQRAQAKAMVEYFKSQQAEAAAEKSRYVSLGVLHRDLLTMFTPYIATKL